MFNQIESVIFYFFNETCKDLLLDYMMPLITVIGDGTFLFGVALVLLLSRKIYKRMSGIFLLAGLTCTYNICHIMKNVIERPRPFLVLQDVSTVYTSSGFSFPSTHSAMVFLAAVILTKCFGKGVIFYFIAVLVAISRIYLGLHYPSDVFVGGLIGVLTGLIIVHFGKKAGIYKKD